MRANTHITTPFHSNTHRHNTHLCRQVERNGVDPLEILAELGIHRPKASRILPRGALGLLLLQLKLEQAWQERNPNQQVYMEFVWRKR